MTRSSPEDTVGTVDATEKYIVTEANDGKLTITPVGGIVVTITGNTGSSPYSGAEQFENTNPNFENVTFIVTDGKLTITPRSVKLTSVKAEKVYDGHAPDPPRCHRHG